MVFDIEEVGGDGLDFNFQINKKQFIIDKDYCSLNGDIYVQGHISRADDDFYLKGRLKTELILNCSRCLDELIYLIDGEFLAQFVPPSDGSDITGEVQLLASDIDIEVYNDNRIDITQSIRDRILLEIPVNCLCFESCRGICSQCGIKLNESACECANFTSYDPRLEVLKNLKDKLK